MKKLLTVLAVTAALVAPSFAKVYKLPKEDSVASIDFPSGWKVEAADDSLEATSDDDEISISVEVNDAESLEGAIQETIGYLKKNKVAVDKSSEKKAEGKLNGFDAFKVTWDGKDEDGPTIISLTVVQIDAKHVLLFTFWASPEGAKKHEEEVSKISQSLKKAD